MIPPVRSAMRLLDRLDSVPDTAETRRRASIVIWSCLALAAVVVLAMFCLT